jgi:hypothetical protein
MSVGVKRAKAKQGATLDPTSWLPLNWPPTRGRLILLEVMGVVWTFQDPGNDRLYRCEIDPDGSERWFFKVIRDGHEWISQSDARETPWGQVKPSESRSFISVFALWMVMGDRWWAELTCWR